MATRLHQHQDAHQNEAKKGHQARETREKHKRSPPGAPNPNEGNRLGQPNAHVENDVKKAEHSNQTNANGTRNIRSPFLLKAWRPRQYCLSPEYPDGASWRVWASRASWVACGNFVR